MASGATEHEQEYIDESEQRWIQEMAKDCRCCPNCWESPCSGVLAGGACDDMPCTCEDDD